MWNKINKSFQHKYFIPTSQTLETIHVGLFPYSKVKSKREDKDFVILDYYSRVTWLYFLAHKDETLKLLGKFYKKIQNEGILKLR